MCNVKLIITRYKYLLKRAIRLLRSPCTKQDIINLLEKKPRFKDVFNTLKIVCFQNGEKY